MRLLQLCAIANWGSQGRIAEGIGAEVLARGDESVIAYGRHSNPSASRLWRVGTAADVYAHYMEHRLLDREGLGSRRATRSLLRLIDGYCPDVVQLHDIHDHWLNYPLLFRHLSRSGVPVVWTMHDCWAFTGGCTHFTRTGCGRWATGCGRCPQRGLHDMSARNFELKRQLLSGFGDRLTLVAVSRWMQGLTRRSFLGDRDIRLIYNGIDLTAFAPGNGRRRNMVLGVAMTWNNRKGLGDLSRLRGLLPGNIEIVVVGLTGRQLRHLPAGISGIGRINDVRQLRALYSQALAFVNPTYEDNFPTVNLEALACGTPVITYDTGGAAEAIDDMTGAVVAQGDVAAMAAAVRRAISGAYGAAACRDRTVRLYDSHNRFAEYHALYEELINRHNPGQQAVVQRMKGS